ncbi:MAG: hypothetical protein ACLR17_06020 [Enterobacteriaceae bacterium]
MLSGTPSRSHHRQRADPAVVLATPQVRNGLYLTAFIFAYGSGIFVTVSFVQVVPTTVMKPACSFCVCAGRRGLRWGCRSSGKTRIRNGCARALLIGTLGSVLCIFGFGPSDSA